MPTESTSVGHGHILEKPGQPEIDQVRTIQSVEQQVFGLEITVDDPSLMGMGQGDGGVTHDLAAPPDMIGRGYSSVLRVPLRSARCRRLDAGLGSRAARHRVLVKACLRCFVRTDLHFCQNGVYRLARLGRRDQEIENRTERSPIDVLHHDIARLAILADEVDSSDAGMLESGDRLSFSLETAYCLLPTGSRHTRSGSDRVFWAERTSSERALMVVANSSVGRV